MLTIERSSRGDHGRCGRRRAVENWVGGEEGMSILVLYPWADKCLEKFVSWSLTMVCKKEAQGPSDTSGITVDDGVS